MIHPAVILVDPRAAAGFLGAVAVTLLILAGIAIRAGRRARRDRERLDAFAARMRSLERENTTLRNAAQPPRPRYVQWLPARPDPLDETRLDATPRNLGAVTADMAALTKQIGGGS